MIKGRNTICCVLGLLASPLVAGSVFGEGEGPAVPAVRLERLFQLPPQAAPRELDALPGGASREEWEERFRLAHGELDAATAALRDAQQELEELASEGGSWQLAVPGAGAGAENSPLSFRLRQEIRGHRESQAEAEAKLTDLRVKASLAGVPQAWQGDQSLPSQDRLERRKQNAGSANNAVDAK